MTQPSPADTLRAAAIRLRGYAKAASLASPGTWTITPERVIRCGDGEGVIVADRSCADTGEDADLPYIAAMHPGVGSALAVLLERQANIASEMQEYLGEQFQDGALDQNAHDALTVARAILGDQP
ncbi:hypothetical protein [Streptomyces sp. NPDC126499]|uniref:hypothetical protein n=1 Tax=Streptomyces sp. NPDC126499 TaxID=3155314 RepID=UPI0033308527